MSKKGQVAIFVIVAVVIVAIILIAFFYSKIPILSGSSDSSPEQYLKSCVEPELRKNINLLSENGGYTDLQGADSGSLMYLGDKIKYLCYTSEYYKTCTVQQPLVKEHFEDELSIIMKSKMQSCLESMQTEFEKRGYDVSLSKSDAKVNFNPGNVQVLFNTPMTLKKADSSKSYNQISAEMPSQMYDLLMISVSIIDFESSFGDSETTDFMQYYPNLKIEKIKLSEGSKVYRVSDVVSNESFRFASRSISWPPGYGI